MHMKHSYKDKINLIKKIIVNLFAFIFFVSIVSTLLSPEKTIFVVPRGSDFEIGVAMGQNTVALITFVVIIYAIKLNFFGKKAPKD